MDERQLEQVAARLGSEAARRLDVEATAQGVLDRLRSAPVEAPVPWWRRTRVLQGAAAAVVILAAGLFVTMRGGRDTWALPELPEPVAIEVLSDAELEEFADSLDFDAPISEQVALGLQDLNEDQLLELLQLMEG